MNEHVETVSRSRNYCASQIYEAHVVVIVIVLVLTIIVKPATASFIAFGAAICATM